MKPLWKLTCVLSATLFIGCGSCDDTSPHTVEDMGIDVGDTGPEPDLNLDMPVDLPVDLPDMQADVEPDADAGPLCGNGQLDDGEECDGNVFRDLSSCGEFGLPEGNLACDSTCKVDTSGCAVCGDGICSDAENASSCVQDCGVKSIAAGRTHTCAVLADGSLWCWGAHEGHGMGGTPDTRIPVRVPGHDNVISVSAGDHHTCFVTADDTSVVTPVRYDVWCFGSNGFGEVGPTADFHVFPPIQVTEGQTVRVGNHHTCAIRSNNDVYCWGRGDYGQRGDGEFSMRKSSATPTATQGANTLDLVMGGHSSCAVYGNRVMCWGDNRRWQLLLENMEWRNTPSRVLNFINYLQVVGVAMGQTHGCFKLQTFDQSIKALKCVGGNAYGQLASEASADTLYSEGGAGGDFGPVAAGYGYTCGVSLEDPVVPQLLCWGDNYFGQLGDGTTSSRHTPAPVDGIGDVLALSGGYDHVCAILPDETARCWGRNREGQIGDGSDQRERPLPVAPIGLGPAGGQQ